MRLSLPPKLIGFWRRSRKNWKTGWHLVYHQNWLVFGGAQEKGKTGWHSVYHQNWLVFGGAHEKKERQDDTQFTTKTDGFWRRSRKRKDRMILSLPPKLIGFLSFIPRWMLIMYFLQVFFGNQLRGSGAVFFFLYTDDFNVRV